MKNKKKIILNILKQNFPLNISDISDKIQFTENESQIAISLNVRT